MPSLLNLNRKAIIGLFAFEFVLIALLSWAFYRGEEGWVIAILAIPAHSLLMATMFRDNYRLLMLFSMVYPFSIIALLPSLYVDVGLFIGIIGLLAFLIVFELAAGKMHMPRLSGVDLLAILTIACTAFVASFLSFIRGDGLQASYLYMLLMVLLTSLVFSIVPRSCRELRFLLYIILFAFALACLTVPFFLARSYGFASRKTFYTLFGKPNLNLVGMVAAAGASIVLGALAGTAKKERVFLVMVLVVLVATVLISRSRGAWAGVGIGMLYILYRLRSFRLLIILTAFIAVLMMHDIFRISIEMRVEQTGVEDPSLLGRFVIWRTAIGMLKDHWLFGIGIENFRRVKYAYGFPRFIDPAFWLNTHNMFLELFISLGIFGGMAFMILPIRAFLRLDRVVQRLVDHRERGLAAGLCAGLLSFATHGMLDSPTWHRPSFIFWGVLLGSSLAAGRLLHSSLPDSKAG